MSKKDKRILTAGKAGTGAVFGLVSGLKGAPAPHFRGIGTGVANVSSKFVNGATKAMKSHKGAHGALAAGIAAVAGHGVIGTALIGAAPVVGAAAAIGGAAYGITKLTQRLRKS